MSCILSRKLVISFDVCRWFSLGLLFLFVDEHSMAYEDVSPPKKRWQQQQSCSSTPSPVPFQLDANQWRQQNILVLDQDNLNIYHMAMIVDINDSHRVRVSMRDQTVLSTIIDLSRPICSHLPSIIIDNIPACQDLLVDTPVCVRRNKTDQINQF